MEKININNKNGASKPHTIVESKRIPYKRERINMPKLKSERVETQCTKNINTLFIIIKNKHKKYTPMTYISCRGIKVFTFRLMF